MITKKNMITKIMIMSGLVLCANQAFAQTNIPFPPNPYQKAQMEAAGCDPNVYNRMYAEAASEYYSRQTAMQKTLVKDQLEASPKQATNSMLKCVDNATNQLQSAGAQAKKLYDMILGAGNIDLAALGKKAINKLGEAACTTVNNYTGAATYSAINPYTSAMTNVPGTIQNAGNINTKLGNINVGNEVVNQMTSQPQPKKPNPYK